MAFVFLFIIQYVEFEVWMLFLSFFFILESIQVEICACFGDLLM